MHGECLPATAWKIRPLSLKQLQWPQWIGFFVEGGTRFSWFRVCSRSCSQKRQVLRSLTLWCWAIIHRHTQNRSTYVFWLSANEWCDANVRDFVCTNQIQARSMRFGQCSQRRCDMAKSNEKCLEATWWKKVMILWLPQRTPSQKCHSQIPSDEGKCIQMTKVIRNGLSVSVCMCVCVVVVISKSVGICNFLIFTNVNHRDKARLA